MWYVKVFMFLCTDWCFFIMILWYCDFVLNLNMLFGNVPHISCFKLIDSCHLLTMLTLILKKTADTDPIAQTHPVTTPCFYSVRLDGPTSSYKFNISTCPVKKWGLKEPTRWSNPFFHPCIPEIFRKNWFAILGKMWVQKNRCSFWIS